MSYIEEIVTLFKKHGVWVSNLLLFIIMCASVVACMVFPMWLFLVNAFWCGASIFDSYLRCEEKEGHSKTKEKLADCEDKLCVAEHEVERLRLELESYKAAEQAKNADKPKRKPAPKRKPKTENKNEEKKDLD